MRARSFKWHRFPAGVIRQALLDDQVRSADRQDLKRKRPAPSSRWNLDEVVCKIGGKRMFLWRAVDDEGKVLDVVVQKRRDQDAALTLLKRLLRNQPVEPEATATVPGA